LQYKIHRRIVKKKKAKKKKGKGKKGKGKKKKSGGMNVSLTKKSVSSPNP